MEVKRLNVGDRLYSEGSWNIIEIKIVSTTEEEAISNNGLFFRRDFSNGDSYFKCNNGFSLDFRNWYLVDY